MSRTEQPIAIVGLGCVFPSSPDPDAFWANIATAEDTAAEVPAHRWAFTPQVFAGEPPAADTVASRRACLVENFTPDLADLDLDAGLMDGLDPMFQLLLHTGRTAWRDAITEPVRAERAGVVIGSIALPTDAVSKFSGEILEAAFRPALQSALGFDAAPAYLPSRFATPPLNRQVCGLPAMLLARALGLGGFAFTLDAACASSLYALKLATEALHEHRLDAVIAGGLSRPDSLYTQMGFTQLRALSSSGRCAPFDARADGLVVGEGCGLLVLKRLEDALAHGDRIHGLVCGAGLSNDLGANLMSPDSEGQLRAMRNAYARAGWGPAEIDLVECHGTGTPLGDAVEFDSMCKAWGEETTRGGCVMGSVKSNVGHTLTAAGAAGILKVLLAMRHEVLPPTANFETPAERISLESSPFRILRSAEPWARRGNGAPRRGAVSGFGFGGVNAHLLVEEYLPEVHARGHARRMISVGDRPGETHAPSPSAIAVVGMGAHFGPFDTLGRFAAQVMKDDVAAPSPLGEWRGLTLDARFEGYRVEAVAFPRQRFRIPPAEIREMLPQQLIMLEVAAAALEDAGAGSDEASVDRLAMGVFVGIGLDLDTTNFHFRWTADARRPAGMGRSSTGEAVSDSWLPQVRDAAHPPLTANRTMGALGSIAASRLARALRAGGPSFSIACEALSGLRALETAMRALTRGDIDTAMVGAVDFSCDPRALVADDEHHRFAPAGAARPFEAHSKGTLAGEGAAALVLKRLEDAERDGDRVYAVIRGAAAACGAAGGKADASAYARAFGAALDEAGWRAADLEYIETHGSGDPQEDAAEIEGLAAVIGSRPAERGCYLGTTKPRIGHAGAAAGLASLVKTALCLNQRVLPGIPGFAKPHPRLAGLGAGCRVPSAARYWLKDRADGPRRAAVAAMGIGGGCAHMLLEAAATPRAGAAGGADAGEESLLLITGDDPERLLEDLDALQTAARNARHETLRQLADHWQSIRPDGDAHALGIGLVAGDLEHLQALLGRARAAVSRGEPSFEDGVYYTPSPQGQDGEVAFVFPGSGNQYAGMGRELALGFPDVIDVLECENAHLASQFAGGRIWDDGALAGLTPRDAILAHVWFGALASDVLRSFRVHPDAVIGYSLGESSGLIATRAWQDRDVLLHRLRNSTLFSDQLAGDCKAARKAWGLTAGQEVNWRVGVVDRPAEVVRRALKGRRWVYLLIVNTPDECVVGGHRNAVEELVRALGCHCHPLEAITTVHCEVAQPIAERYRALHLLPTRSPEGLRFYSSAWASTYDVTRETAADSILAQALAPFEFPRVIESAYGDGVRVFVEIGPGRSCSRMIDRILEGKPHAAVAAFPGARDERGALLRALARLAAERVPLSLAPLSVFTQARGEAAAADRLTIPLEAPRFVVPPPTRKTSAEVLTLPGRPAPAIATKPAPAANAGGASMSEALVRQAAHTESARAGAHATFLKLARHQSETLARAVDMQVQLAAGSPHAAAWILESAPLPPAEPQPRTLLDRPACLQFAVGSIGAVLGESFAPVDAFPTRVRLPDEPLMLVDRILEIDAEPRSMSHGRIVTEHDVLPDAWYLDAGRIPTCIAVEAGQADLFLSGYLGIDFETRGLAVYRLLDARITFHGLLPEAGATIHYDIRIEGFFKQDDTHLFRFNFDASVDGKPLLTMRDGCAGFFTEAKLAAGQGIVRSTLDAQTLRSLDHTPPNLVPMQQERYSDDKLQALREGNLAACFGNPFINLPLKRPVGLPGGRMKLVDRITNLDPKGGRYGKGVITGEADIHSDDWFLTCHFIDDQVMPGTLMYECCLHTLRIYLMRLGWVCEADEVAYEPVPNVSSTLKCRGQVTAATRQVQYEISIRELGYSQAGSVPYVIADALMYADHKPIVQMSNMSLQLSGLTRQRVESIWSSGDGHDGANPEGDDKRPPLFDSERILAFAVGKPSEAFGEPYRVFDHSRRIARLPGPPYQFLDRITRIENCRPFELQAGGEIEAQYEVPTDAWYFAANRQRSMPFAVLLEVALQPCGWLAAYLGSALASDVDLRFRNLGGTAVQREVVNKRSATLTTTVKITNVSRSGGMIIQNFDFTVSRGDKTVYQGDTYFGFFSADALQSQVGLGDAALDEPDTDALQSARSLDFPDGAPFADKIWRMVDEIEAYLPRGGHFGEGYVRGGVTVDPEAWFFKAHFFQDPVWPGSLGIESFLQLLEFAAVDRFSGNGNANLEFQCPALDVHHEWIYRGQVLPTDSRVNVYAHVSKADPAGKTIHADGYLGVDGRRIYQMKNFAVRIKS